MWGRHAGWPLSARRRRFNPAAELVLGAAQLAELLGARMVRVPAIPVRGALVPAGSSAMLRPPLIDVGWRAPSSAVHPPQRRWARSGRSSTGSAPERAGTPTPARAARCGCVFTAIGQRTGLGPRQVTGVFVALLASRALDRCSAATRPVVEMADVTRQAELDELHHPSLRRGRAGPG
jgi:hypothetical protein